MNITSKSFVKFENPVFTKFNRNGSFIVFNFSKFDISDFVELIGVHMFCICIWFNAVWSFNWSNPFLTLFMCCEKLCIWVFELPVLYVNHAKESKIIYLLARLDNRGISLICQKTCPTLHQCIKLVVSKLKTKWMTFILGID